MAISGSKFAIMNGNETKILGNFNQYEEAFFSNTSYYKRASYVYPKSSKGLIKYDGYDYGYGCGNMETFLTSMIAVTGLKFQDGSATKEIGEIIAKELDKMGYILYVN